jgi:cobalt-precorrin 5A hydrolase / precorrin-3B C17-methyltransferase
MDTGARITVFYVTDEGRRLGERLKGLYPGVAIMKFAKDGVESSWLRDRAMLFVMATGIVVRALSGLIRDKRSDPAVIVLDERGDNVISLLSGHLGGANERTEEIAAFLGSRAVITTGSDVAGLTSLDLWAREKGLKVDDRRALPRMGTRLIDRGNLAVFSDGEISLPADLLRVTDPGAADILVTNRKDLGTRDGLYLRPANLVVGMGCNSGTSAEEIGDAVRATLDEHNLSFLSLSLAATIDRKREEPGIKAFCERYALDLVSFTPEELNAVSGISLSEAAFKATGARAVAEPAALLGAGATSLLANKRKSGNVTVAVAEMGTTSAIVKPQEPAPRGSIYVVGIGPGDVEHMTGRALRAIRNSDVIVGYDTYLALIRDLVADKQVFTTAMTREVDRCRKAIQCAREGKTVAVISGGDPGIYAMAGLVFELLADEGKDMPALPVEVIPGISALNASAARLGAPLMHDFASISLSDRLTSWETIEKRLDAAAMADFVIILYNPKSRGRAGHIEKARDIILRHRTPATPVGIVHRAMREDERAIITSLGAMPDHEIDMQTTVIIGNSKTFVWRETMITPRGYEDKIHSR